MIFRTQYIDKSLHHIHIDIERKFRKKKKLILSANSKKKKNTMCSKNYTNRDFSYTVHQLLHHIHIDIDIRKKISKEKKS